MFNCDNIVGFLKDKQIIIYGAGYVASKFYDLLVLNGLDDNVSCFVVTGNITEGCYKNGHMIKSIYDVDINENSIICLAVHEALKVELETVLSCKEIKNYIWVYPYFYQLLHSEPLQLNAGISVDKIIQANEDYRFAIRYLAIENYYNKNDNGFDIYTKTMTLCSGYDTARKRLEGFLALIKSWEEYGYISDYACWIDSDYQAFDGTHRITLAKYFNKETIICNIYNAQSGLLEQFSGKGLLLKKDVESLGLTLDEISVIEMAYHNLRGE